jgi:hypothetical protein
VVSVRSEDRGDILFTLSLCSKVMSYDMTRIKASRVPGKPGASRGLDVSRC